MEDKCFVGNMPEQGEVTTPKRKGFLWEKDFVSTNLGAQRPV